MRKKFIIISLIVCMTILQSCSNGKHSNDTSDYGRWQKGTQEILMNEFSNSLPNQDVVNQYAQKYYYKTRQGILTEHNFVISVSLQFPDKSIFLMELDKYKNQFQYLTTSEYIMCYAIQYSPENASEYVNEEVYDGMFFNFEIILANEKEYRIDFINAHVWDYYKDTNLIEYLQKIKEPNFNAKNTKYLQSSFYPNLHTKGEQYEVYTDNDGTGYYYIIYNIKQDIIDEGYCSWKFNAIEQKDNLLELSYGTSGGPFFNARYYDLENDRVSRLFAMPLATTTDLVAYFEHDDAGIKLVIQDIFDSSVYYKEIFDESFSTTVFSSRGSAVFKEKNEQIIVTYPGVSGEIMSKTFELK